jgi:hypothetical protein
MLRRVVLILSAFVDSVGIRVILTYPPGPGLGIAPV